MRNFVGAALLVAAGLTVTACSGDDDDDDAGGGSASSDEFCVEAGELMQDGDAFGDPASSEVDDALARAEALDPPDGISGAWSTLVEGARLLHETEPTDLASGEIPEEIQRMGAASTTVYAYLADECGIELFDELDVDPPSP